jgi:hypothetical protein
MKLVLFTYFFILVYLGAPALWVLILRMGT